MNYKFNINESQYLDNTKEKEDFDFLIQSFVFFQKYYITLYGIIGICFLIIFYFTIGCNLIYQLLLSAFSTLLLMSILNITLSIEKVYANICRLIKYPIIISKISILFNKDCENNEPPGISICYSVKHLSNKKIGVLVLLKDSQYIVADILTPDRLEDKIIKNIDSKDVQVLIDKSDGNCISKDNILYVCITEIAEDINKLDVITETKLNNIIFLTEHFFISHNKKKDKDE